MQQPDQKQVEVPARKIFDDWIRRRGQGEPGELTPDPTPEEVAKSVNEQIRDERAKKRLF